MTTIRTDATSADESEQATAPARRRPSLARAVWLVVTASLVTIRIFGPSVSSEGLSDFGWVGIGWLTEVWILAGVAVWLVRRVGPRLARRRTRVAFVFVVAAMCLAQLVPLRPFEVYPLASWGMYSIPQDPMVHTEFRMQRAGEEAGHLPVADVVPNTLGRAFMARLTQWAERAEAGDDQALEVLTETFGAVLDELGDETIDAVEVRECSMSGRDVDGRSCRTMVTVPR